MKAARDHFPIENPEMPDATFLMELSLSDEPAKRVALSIRQMISDTLAIPMRNVGPETKLSDLFATGWDGGDSVEFILQLEKILQFEIPDEDCGQFEQIKTVRQLVRFAVRLMECHRGESRI